MTTSNFTRMDIYSPVQTATFSRTQEKQELQELNDRFAAYVQRVRMVAERGNYVDSSAILQSTKAMELEIINLKNMYEQELDKMRKELESCTGEKAAHQVQANKHMQCAAQLQDMLSVESSKHAKLQDEINNYQRCMTCLEAEIRDLKIAANRPQAEIDQLLRSTANLTREAEAWKHRYEHEQVARQESENRIQQLMQKSDFNEKVCAKRMGEMNSRMEMSAATILSLEGKVRELSKADISVSDLLKQVRDTAEAELRKYQMESEEQYNKNLTALKVQLDNDAKKGMENLEMEKTQFRGTIGELQARIRNLEGQVVNLDYQKKTLEEAVSVERSCAAESVRALEGKLREVQELLMAKMREVTSAREHSIPLKAEIEALKVLLQEEEKRLHMPLGHTTTTIAATTTAAASYPEAMTNYSITANTAANASTFSAFNNTAPTTTTPTPQPCMYDARPYTPSPPLSVTYIPESLQPMGTSLDPMFCYPHYGDELDPQLFGYSGTMPLAKYTCENGPSVNRVVVEPSPPTTPRPGGASRAKSAPAERHRNLNLVRSDLGQGHDYFDKMFYDLQQDTLYSQGRPRSSHQNERPASSVYHDYAVSTSSATGDVKIVEVHQEGKYIRLLNEGAQEVEFGGFMIQQNVGGHPVAVFRFPPRSKFASNSIITVYAGCNDRALHKPPQDYVWKEQQKWGSGPECTTILCRANGQAVAWTTAAHRFARDAFQDGQPINKNENRAVTIMEEKPGEETADDDSLAEGNTNGNAAKMEASVSLRREKQQPPSLQASGNGHSGGGMQVQDSCQGLQSACPDIVPVQRSGGAGSQRKYVSGVSTHQHTAMRTTGKSPQGFGDEGREEPSGLQSPLTRPLLSGPDLLQCQQPPQFLPPVTLPPLSPAW
ncbi:hypothetical protein ACOMHN_026450 [Nucella lapillus]